MPSIFNTEKISQEVHIWIFRSCRWGTHGEVKMESINKYINTMECARGGKMKWAIINDNLHVGYIDICSQNLPEAAFKASSFKGTGAVPIKINYCFHGRCEVMLGCGVTTFVVGNEFALDYGTSGNGEAAFFYPSSEYEGVELILNPSEELMKKLSAWGGDKVLRNIIKKFEDMEIPIITSADPRIVRIMEDIRDDLVNFTDINLLKADVIKAVLVLKGLSFEMNNRRTYYTKSQVDIAKKTFEIITGDLSKRYSAAELADCFGVSESSLKNYFRAVFGRGYKEMISEIRMQKAAELIMEGKKSMGEIAEFIGYQNQSRFSEAFFRYHKMLPLEYKRTKHIAKKDKNAV
jgi:AraC-like DNA-binding protein